MDHGERCRVDGTIGIGVRGPLAAYAQRWRAELVGRGYSRRSVSQQLGLVAHLSRWMDGEGRAVAELSVPVVDDFLRARRDEGHRSLLSVRAVVPLLRYLYGLGVAPDPAARGSVSVVEVLLEEYCEYLDGERGLVAATVRQYCDYARAFLVDLPDPIADSMRGLTSGQVTDFMLAYSADRNAWSAKAMVTALRSLLRFLHVAGHAPLPLASAVPSVPSWTLASLPRGLEAMGVDSLLATCDRQSAKGRRDYAIVLLLSRLGLRAAEVAGLELDDVDWRAGALLVCGKGRRVDQMPLPVDVGEALADYLRHGRPRSPSRKLFCFVRAPWSGLAPTAVCQIVATAGNRAGSDRRIGAHRLRHAVACDVLRRGGSLTEVGQLLRHRDQRSTAVYAKVDYDALRAVARPWPGGAA